MLYAQSAITVISITISARDYDGRSAFMTMIMIERSVSYHEQDYDDFENYGCYYYSCDVLMMVMRN